MSILQKSVWGKVGGVYFLSNYAYLVFFTCEFHICQHGSPPFKISREIKIKIFHSAAFSTLLENIARSLCNQNLGTILDYGEHELNIFKHDDLEKFSLYKEL